MSVIPVQASNAGRPHPALRGAIPDAFAAAGNLSWVSTFDWYELWELYIVSPGKPYQPLTAII